MPDIDWKSIIRGSAPVLAGALGGPLAAAAVKVLGDSILGNPDATETDLAAAVVAGLSGEQIAAMKEAEQRFQLEMRRIDQQSDAAVLADVQNARNRQIETKDNMPQVIFFMLMAVYVFEICLFWFGAVPTDEFVRALVTRAFSTVEVGLTGAIAYFIGSSRGSKRAGDSNREVAEQLARKI